MGYQDRKIAWLALFVYISLCYRWYEMWTSSFNLCHCIHHENV